MTHPSCAIRCIHNQTKYILLYNAIMYFIHNVIMYFIIQCYNVFYTQCYDVLHIIKCCNRNHNINCYNVWYTMLLCIEYIILERIQILSCRMLYNLFNVLYIINIIMIYNVLYITMYCIFDKWNNKLRVTPTPKIKINGHTYMKYSNLQYDK